MQLPLVFYINDLTLPCIRITQSHHSREKQFKMHFLGLPQDILDMLFEAIVQNDVNGAFPARAVNQFFKDAIEQQMITNTPLSELLAASTSRSVTSWAGKKQNLYSIPAYRIKHRPGHPDCDGEFSVFLRTVIDELMEFAPADADSSKTRKQYQNSLLYALASQNQHSSLGRIYQPAPDPAWQSDDTDDTIQTSRGHYCRADLLAAAAAVGNKHALSSFLEHPSMLLEGSFLGGVWDAAVSLDNIGSIHFLIEQLEWINPLKRPQLSTDWPALKIHSAFSMAVHLGSAQTGNALIDFLIRHGWVSQRNDEDVMGMIEWAMAAGSMEIFYHAHQHIPDIEQFRNYQEHLLIGFDTASRNGHGSFIRHLLENARTPPVQDIVADSVCIWSGFNNWNWCEFYNPLLIAAAYSRISALDAFIKHDHALIYFQGLLEAAVLGSLLDDPRDEAPHYQKARYFDYYRQYQKVGQRHTATHFLFENGLTVTGHTIQLTNYFAKMFLAQNGVTTDFSMTLIILLGNLKTHYGQKKLLKQLHVPVKKAIQLIIDLRPDMRPIGVDGYAFIPMAEELHAWLTSDQKKM